MPLSRVSPLCNPRRSDTPHARDTHHAALEDGGTRHRRRPGGPRRPRPDRHHRPGRRHDDRVRRSTYYKNAVGKTGTSLKSSLHTIISSQTKISYSAVWNALKATDQDPNNSNNVILLYSGVSAQQVPQRRRRRRLEPRARLGQVPRRLRRARPAPAPTCTTCARRTSGQQHPRQQGLRQRRQRRQQRRRQPHRLRLLRAARRGQGRRGPHDPLHGGPLRGRRRLRRPGAQRAGRQRQRPVHGQALRPQGSGTRRTRRAPSRRTATRSSTTPTSTTATRSSTTRSGSRRSGEPVTAPVHVAGAGPVTYLLCPTRLRDRDPSAGAPPGPRRTSPGPRRSRVVLTQDPGPLLGHLTRVLRGLLPLALRVLGPAELDEHPEDQRMAVPVPGPLSGERPPEEVLGLGAPAGTQEPRASASRAHTVTRWSGPRRRSQSSASSSAAVVYPSNSSRRAPEPSISQRDFRVATWPSPSVWRRPSRTASSSVRACASSPRRLQHPLQL